MDFLVGNHEDNYQLPFDLAPNQKLLFLNSRQGRLIGYLRKLKHHLTQRKFFIKVLLKKPHLSASDFCLSLSHRKSVWANDLWKSSSTRFLEFCQGIIMLTVSTIVFEVTQTGKISLVFFQNPWYSPDFIMQQNFNSQWLFL